MPTTRVGGDMTTLEALRCAAAACVPILQPRLIGRGLWRGIPTNNAVADGRAVPSPGRRMPPSTNDASTGNASPPPSRSRCARPQPRRIGGAALSPPAGATVARLHDDVSMRDRAIVVTAATAASSVAGKPAIPAGGPSPAIDGCAANYATKEQEEDGRGDQRGSTCTMPPQTLILDGAGGGGLGGGPTCRHQYPPLATRDPSGHVHRRAQGRHGITLNLLYRRTAWPH
jgi:hypothetical protein